MFAGTHDRKCSYSNRSRKTGIHNSDFNLSWIINKITKTNKITVIKQICINNSKKFTIKQNTYFKWFLKNNLEINNFGKQQTIWFPLIKYVPVKHT